ncbi:PREDICTED: aspartic [Prunus dulcis]|uniref:PREDICTED: aspartic n=1 Tax=Prunus dulcis TaxID=3755 RepID=A0A5E4EFL6_PRUDU|nr:aspartic proteinase-like protein 1 [Prunus dulcis]VVA13749.1 PREDICTED: aspartic [Prunus dulcis]
MAVRAILFLLWACLFVNGSLSLTLSSKLVHRFSEEAMAVWESRRGDNASLKPWPKRNSLNYFQLLLQSDLKRQKLKLGSKYEHLFPSEGSQTLFFGNELDWLHYTWIDIGTPNVSFMVALDAGSDLLWVPCDCIQCAPLSASYYDTLDRDLNEYSPSLSRTGKQLSCSHQLCKSTTNCKGPEEPCPYIVQYKSDDTASSGFLIEDVLHLTSASKNSTPSSVQASVVFGCGRKQSGGYLEGAAPDGVMGLGPGEISVPSVLAKAGMIQNSFSLCFDDNGSGRILFGDQGNLAQHSTPFLPAAGKYVNYFVGVERLCVGSSCLKQTGFQALVDSGSSFTYVPTEVYKKIVFEFDKQVNATRINLQQSPWKYCYNVSSWELLSIPTIKLMFPLNQSFLVHKPVFSESLNQKYTIFCLTLLRTDDDYGVIGQNFMVGYRMVFDRENLKLGWSIANCEDNGNGKRVNPTPSNNGSTSQLPTSEQQSIPNTHAVAPATARNAPSKSSVAASRQIPLLLCLTSSLLLLMRLLILSC